MTKFVIELYLYNDSYFISGYLFRKCLDIATVMLTNSLSVGSATIQKNYISIMEEESINYE